MTCRPAQYLLRFDDLCPTLSRERWRIFRSLIEEFRLKPILAIVPDNRDSELDVSPPDSAFWEQMRRLEAAGATVGLHGYRHLCESRGRNLLGLSPTSEFAGVAEATQRAWIADGLRILRSQALNPRVWIAPRHGFDMHTLEALRAEGIFLLSDGFSRRPFLRGNLTWIPQQLWAPVEKTAGLWTICIHPNTARDEEISALRAFLRANAAQFTSVDQILDVFPSTTLTRAERIQADSALWRVKLSRVARRIRMSAFFSASKSS